MFVHEVMTRNVECIQPEAGLMQAAQKMKELDVGPLPVCEDGRLVGMVTDRDITVRATAESLPPGLGRVRDVMTPEVICCFEDQDVNEAAQLMKANQVRRIVVLDRNKHLVGIVSLGDLAVDTRNEEMAGATPGSGLRAVGTPPLGFLPSPLEGEGLGVRGRSRFRASPPHPQPLSLEGRGGGRKKAPLFPRGRDSEVTLMALFNRFEGRARGDGLALAVDRIALAPPGCI